MGKQRPNLARMVRQFLAAPATTGEIERVFSGAGKLHDSFKKSTKETTIEAALKGAITTAK